MTQNRGVEGCEFGAHVQSEFVIQPRGVIAIRLKCFGGASGSVQREHAEPARAITQRVFVTQRCGVDQSRCHTSRGQQCSDAGFAALRVHFFECRRLHFDPVLVAEIFEERSADPGQCTICDGQGLLPLSCPNVLVRRFRLGEECGPVDVLIIDVEHITRWLPDDDRRRGGVDAQSSPQIRDVGLQTRHRAGRRVSLPQHVDQPIGRHDPSAVGQ